MIGEGLGHIALGTLNVENCVSETYVETWSPLEGLGEEVSCHVVGGTVRHQHFLVGDLLGDEEVADVHVPLKRLPAEAMMSSLKCLRNDRCDRPRH